MGLPIELIQQVFQVVSESGIFAVLFLILLCGLGYLVYRIANEVVRMIKENMSNIVESNSKFADSSEKMVDLISILVEQTEATAEQLKYIKSNMHKQNTVLIECIKTLESIIPNKSPETEVRLENIIKEIQRPLDI